MDTPLAKEARINYNLIKPHSALEGQTPAQKAGIGVNGQNKWMELLKIAIANDNQ